MAVNLGGYPGAGVHMGVGAQPGGLNARTTARKNAKPKKPLRGFFQYGHNQWGFINEKGQVNWNAKGPTMVNGKYKQNVIGFDRLTAAQKKNMPKRKAIQKPKPAWWDSNRQLQEVELRKRVGDERADLTRQLGEFKHLYSQGQRQLEDDFMQDFHAANASLAARGLIGSGMQSTTDTNRLKQKNRMMTDLRQQFGDIAQGRVETSLKKLGDYQRQAQQAYNQQAIQYYKDTHKGQKPPKASRPKGFKKVGGQWTFTDKNGIPRTISANHPALQAWLKKQKKAKQKAKKK